MATSVDSSLENWNTIAKKQNWNTLLLGNGASIAVHKIYQYKSLFDTARNSGKLTAEEIKFFDTLTTVNFEKVLSYLFVSETFCNVMTEATAAAKFKKKYEIVRNALVDAVQDSHTSWNDFDSKNIAGKIRSALRAYSFVFSTNYDLLVYWSIMSDTKGFVDYFFDKSGSDSIFDISNTSIYHWNQNSTRVLYLHGALHLASNPLTGRITKLNHNGSQSILDRFKADPGLIPLFVAEGSWRDKLSAIYTSEYLSFALSQFYDYRGPTVVFGHSLSEESDNHLVKIMKNWRDSTGNRPQIAISIYPSGDAHSIIGQKNEIMKQLDNPNVIFFDSTTHPLGDSSLKIA